MIKVIELQSVLQFGGLQMTMNYLLEFKLFCIFWNFEQYSKFVCTILTKIDEILMSAANETANTSVILPNKHSVDSNF